MNPIVEWTPEIVAAIKRTCVPGGALPPDAEFSMFLAYCKATGLNPVAKEAYLNERRSKDFSGNWRSSWQIMVARDGYLSAAHRSGRFAGMETRVFPEDPTTTPTHATCRVWRKDWQHPIEVTVSFSEYVEYKDGKPTKMWAGKPRTMIGKVAESQALRRAFGLHGSYSEEELQDEAAGQVSDPQSPALSGDSPAPALPAPAFKDVLGAKLAAARSSPAKLAVVTHDQDGLPVHPMDDEEPPLEEPEGPPSPMPIAREVQADKDRKVLEILGEMKRVLPPLTGEARKSGDAREKFQGHFFDVAHECFGIELRVMGEFADRLAVLPWSVLVDGLEKLKQLEVRS